MRSNGGADETSRSTSAANGTLQNETHIHPHACPGACTGGNVADMTRPFDKGHLVTDHFRWP